MLSEFCDRAAVNGTSEKLLRLCVFQDLSNLSGQQFKREGLLDERYAVFEDAVDGKAPPHAFHERVG
jgi:hypothetical protein